jgi:hypothetical protein
MRRTLCAIFFTILVASTSQAGYVGEVNLSTGSYTGGSLGSTPGGPLVGTNLLATTATSAGGAVTNIGGYFDFTTGAQTSNANGITTYAAGGTFYVLSGVLPTNGDQNPPSYSTSYMSTGVATQTETSQQVVVDAQSYNIYMLTMDFSTNYLSSTLTNAFNSPSDSLSNRIYSGTVTFTFINDNSIGGNQLLSGSISYSYSVPEPSSYAMLLIGGLGVLGYGRRRLRGDKVA